MALPAQAVENVSAASGAESSDTPLASESVSFPESNDLLFSSFALLNILLANLIVSINFFSAVRPQLMPVVGGITLGLSIVVLYFSLKANLTSAWPKLLRGAVTVEFCKGLALICAALSATVLLLHDFVAFSQTRPSQTFIFLAFLLALEGTLNARFKRYLYGALGFSIERSSPKVRVVELPEKDAADRLKNTDTNKLVEKSIAAQDVQPGQVCRSTAGEILACDGIIIDGCAELKERRVSALARLVYRSPGQEVYAGSELVRGELIYKVINPLQDATFSNFTSVLNERVAKEFHAARQRNVYENTYSIGLIFIGVFCLLVARERGVGLEFALNVASAVLCVALWIRIVAFCAFLRGLGLTAAFKHGALLQDTRVMERLARLKKFVFDMPESGMLGQLQIRSFEIVDERIDEKGLISALLALLSASDREFGRAAVAHLSGLVREPLPMHKVSDVHVYDDAEMHGVISGQEFSVGSEEFLVERGVHLQSSEIGIAAPNEYIVYVALGADLIARFNVVKPFVDDAKAFVTELSKLGIRTILIGRNAEVLDQVGRNIGLELASVHGGIKDEEYQKKLESFSPTAFYSLRCDARKFLHTNDVGFSLFDELLWDLNGSEVILFDRTFLPIASLIKLSRLTMRLFVVTRAAAIGVLAIALILASTGLVSPSMVALVGVTGIIGVYLPLKLLVK